MDVYNKTKTNIRLETDTMINQDVLDEKCKRVFPFNKALRRQQHTLT